MTIFSVCLGDRPSKKQKPSKKRKGKRKKKGKRNKAKKSAKLVKAFTNLVACRGEDATPPQPAPPTLPNDRKALVAPASIVHSVVDPEPLPGRYPPLNPQSLVAQLKVVLPKALFRSASLNNLSGNNNQPELIPRSLSLSDITTIKDVGFDFFDISQSLLKLANTTVAMTAKNANANNNRTSDRACPDSGFNSSRSSSGISGSLRSLPGLQATRIILPSKFPRSDSFRRCKSSLGSIDQGFCEPRKAAPPSPLLEKRKCSPSSIVTAKLPVYRPPAIVTVKADKANTLEKLTLTTQLSTVHKPPSRPTALVPTKATPMQVKVTSIKASVVPTPLLVRATDAQIKKSVVASKPPTAASARGSKDDLQITGVVRSTSRSLQRRTATPQRSVSTPRQRRKELKQLEQKAAEEKHRRSASLARKPAPRSTEASSKSVAKKPISGHVRRSKSVSSLPKPKPKEEQEGANDTAFRGLVPFACRRCQSEPFGWNTVPEYAVITRNPEEETILFDPEQFRKTDAVSSVKKLPPLEVPTSKVETAKTPTSTVAAKAPTTKVEAAKTPTSKVETATCKVDAVVKPVDVAKAWVAPRSTSGNEASEAAIVQTGVELLKQAMIAILNETPKSIGKGSPDGQANKAESNGQKGSKTEPNGQQSAKTEPKGIGSAKTEPKDVAKEDKAVKEAAGSSASVGGGEGKAAEKQEGNSAKEGGADKSAATSAVLSPSTKMWTFYKNKNAQKTVSPADLASSFNMAGLVGFKNAGNTCFLSAMLQCLSHTVEMSVSLMASTKTPPKSGLANPYIKLLHIVWTSLPRTRSPPAILATETAELPVKVKHTVPVPVLEAIMDAYPIFADGQQHDTQEAMRVILGLLQEELKEAAKEPRLGDLLTGTIGPRELAKLNWRDYMSQEASLLAEVFVGQLRSHLACKACGHGSDTFDPIWDLPLHFPTNTTGAVDLKVLLQKFNVEEMTDGDTYCNKCDKKQCFTKSVTFQRFPKVLVIYLSRFKLVAAGNSEKMARYSKLKTAVRVHRSLDLAPYASSDTVLQTPLNGRQVCYDLYALANHTGGMHGGHYTAWVQHHASQLWYTCDDQRVCAHAPMSDTSKPSFLSNEAYVLFYRKRA